jgi:putative ABC transport system substrate-binding protein
MRRRDVIALIGGAAAWPLSARAQPRATTPHIGYIWLGAADEDDSTIRGLRQGLRDLGYLEGRDVMVDYRYADGHEERLAALITELVDAKVAIILSPGTIVTRAVKAATRTIPVVSTTADPVASGLVQNLARPGGNITGLSIAAGPGMPGKWFQILREIVPGASRIAVVSSSVGRSWEEMRKTAEGLGVSLLIYDVRSPTDLPIAFDAIAKDGGNAMIVDSDPLLVSYRRTFVEFAATHQLPVMYGLRDFVDAGGLIAYDASIFEIWRRAASYIDKILKGAKPADLPVEQPTRLELIINLKTAKALGLTIPPTLLARADEVIE